MKEAVNVSEQTAWDLEEDAESMRHDREKYMAAMQTAALYRCAAYLHELWSEVQQIRQELEEKSDAV